MENRISRVLLFIILFILLLSTATSAFAYEVIPPGAIPYNSLPLPVTPGSAGIDYAYGAPHNTEGMHTGEDIACDKNSTDVFAPYPGKIIYADQTPEFGLAELRKLPGNSDLVWQGGTIFIQYGWLNAGHTVPYSGGFVHLKNIDPAIQVGSYVRRGQRLGLCGFTFVNDQTNWHLHWQAFNLFYETLNSNLKQYAEGPINAGFGWINPQLYPSYIYPLEGVPADYYLETLSDPQNYNHLFQSVVTETPVTAVVPTEVSNGQPTQVANNSIVVNPDQVSKSTNSICGAGLLLFVLIVSGIIVTTRVFRGF